jgi:CO/xanthine dehydrogenase FAD-binding subunit
LGKKATVQLFGHAAAEVAASINPSADIHASESYRRSLARVLTRRALAEAWSKAQR